MDLAFVVRFRVFYKERDRDRRAKRQPVSRGALSALAHGFLLAVCQSEDRYKGGFFPIEIKLAWTTRKSNIQMLMRSKTKVYQEGCTAGSLVKIFLSIKKEIMFMSRLTSMAAVKQYRAQRTSCLTVLDFSIIYITIFDLIDLAGKCN